ncbi:MAG TPA: Rrf2 family transcriptional regulator [Blastocatellia bacterium]|nr:Rrf2 family transcriptional regulator [Blastocatellia bacterium]
MKITAQEEYGLRCILQLAREQIANSDSNLESDAIFVRDIAEREGLSVAYVEKILWTLSRSGIVESVRGPKGGYRLTSPASEISLGQVMRALGGIPSEEEICSQFTGNQDICVHHDGCGLKPVWTSISDFVNSVFDGVPISSLLNGSVDVKFVQITNKSGAKEPVRARPAA